MANLVLVAGHAIEQVFYDFPHRCPGKGCAIGVWLAKQHYARRVYDGLRPKSETAPKTGVFRGENTGQTAGNMAEYTERSSA